MDNWLKITEIVSGVSVVVFILLQHRGTGLGGTFGGQDVSYRSRRGLEKLLFRLTIVAAAVFILTVIGQVFIV